MKVIDIYIRVTITILGLAYPILLQVIARLDEKYSSNHIVELFDNEKPKKWFRILLVSSLISIFIWTFQFEPLFHIKGWNYFIDNSANILVLINVTALVVLFFLYVNKILVYYTPIKFIKYLINKHKKKGSDLRYFNALSDVFLLSVQKQNQNISQTLSRFFYDVFRNEREKMVSKPVEYPESYYSLVYKTIEELAILKNKKNSILEYRTAGGIWLLGELQGSEISEVTYSWLWRNILLSVKYEQDDMVMYHWETAHQYFSFHLEYIHPIRESRNGNFEIKNKDAVEKRKLERNRFLEFHYALGGLLLYKKRIDCIRRMFYYTTSQPPRYELLPGSMDEVFKLFFEFRDPYESKYMWISHKYSFPEQNGVNSDGVVKKWISYYITVLFLRQYTIIPYLIYMKPLDFPTVPKTQGEKKEWIDGLDLFKVFVVELLDNKELIDLLKLHFLTKEWCVKNSKDYPIDFIVKLKEQLIVEYGDGATNLAISEEKVNEFYNSTTKIIEDTFSKYSTFFNEISIEKDYNKWFIKGQRMIQSKDAFSANPEVHNFNFDSFLASIASDNIKDCIASTFAYNKSKCYLIQRVDLFIALEKLGINENYIIVSFGINIQYYIDYLKIKGLSIDNFNGIKLLTFNGADIVDQSLFIINKSDLPNIIPCDIDKDTIDKYELTPISTDYKIYASVLDLKRVKVTIRDENKDGYTEDELNKSALLNIILLTEIRWKKNVDLIQLIEYSEYNQKGLPNNLSDIEVIGKK